jgi:hypothetical protein
MKKLIIILIPFFFACSKKETVNPVEQTKTNAVVLDYYTFRVEATNNNKPIRYIISKADTTIKRGNRVYQFLEPEIDNYPIGYFSYSDTILKRNSLQITCFNKHIADTSKIQMNVYIDNVKVFSSYSNQGIFKK